MSITRVILRKNISMGGRKGGGMISKREIPSPSIFDKRKKYFSIEKKDPF